MKKFESITVVGGSGTGKTTLIDGLRIPQYDDLVVIPRRYSTRPSRSDDLPHSTLSISREEFDERMTNGLLNPHYTKLFEEGREENYGFETVDPIDARLRIFSASNPFTSPTFRKVLETSLVVSLNAFPTTRLDRILQREVDPTKLHLGELSARLLDLAIPKDISNVVTSLNTSELSPEQGQEAFRTIIDEVLSEK